MSKHIHSHVPDEVENPSLDRNLALSIGLNALIVIAEFAGGLVSGSLALLSDAMHNLSDVAALALALAARKLGALETCPGEFSLRETGHEVEVAAVEEDVGD